MSSGEIVNTGPNNGQDRNNKFDFACGIRKSSKLGNCIQAIDKNCICVALRGQYPCQKTQQHGLKLTDICTAAYISESDLNDGELIPAEPDAVVDKHLLMEHYKGASWAYLTDEAENDYVFETMATCGLTKV
ncbi:alpha-actinin A [Biomphalaria glabrata]|nr:alpha-actinin A [Biomphalaria glabrata]